MKSAFDSQTKRKRHLAIIHITFIPVRVRVTFVAVIKPIMMGYSKSASSYLLSRESFRGYGPKTRQSEGERGPTTLTPGAYDMTVAAL